MNAGCSIITAKFIIGNYTYATTANQAKTDTFIFGSNCPSIWLYALCRKSSDSIYCSPHSGLYSESIS